mmetsp:Transcript_32795/g.59888  ORF Transcript_32795/g.59888 Transcript_32795/m.59888 type:complete len:187 (-) Transcript_32795:686-1246(-)
MTRTSQHGLGKQPPKNRDLKLDEGPRLNAHGNVAPPQSARSPAASEAEADEVVRGVRVTVDFRLCPTPDGVSEASTHSVGVSSLTVGVATSFIVSAGGGRGAVRSGVVENPGAVEKLKAEGWKPFCTGGLGVFPGTGFKGCVRVSSTGCRENTPGEAERDGGRRGRCGDPRKVPELRTGLFRGGDE